MADQAPLDVLVIDDEFLIRWAVLHTLAGAGHHVREAADAASAIVEVRDGKVPDVALVDYRLPDTRGLDLVERLHTLAPGMAIVMMTADDPSDLARAHALGVHRVLHKPFELDTIEPALRDAHLAQATPH